MTCRGPRAPFRIAGAVSDDEGHALVLAMGGVWLLAALLLRHSPPQLTREPRTCHIISEGRAEHAQAIDVDETR